MRFIDAFAALALAASVAACADSAEPTSDNPPAFSEGSSASDQSTGRHIVKFNGAPLATFVEQVEALGGRVDWTGAGLASLSGLNASAKDVLAARTDVALIIDDPALAIGFCDVVDGRIFRLAGAEDALQRDLRPSVLVRRRAGASKHPRRGKRQSRQQPHRPAAPATACTMYFWEKR